MQHTKYLALVLDMIDLLRFQYLNFFEDLGCVEFVSLPVFDKSHPSEGAFVKIYVPTPIVLRTS